MASPAPESDWQHLLAIADSIPALLHTGRPDGYLDYFNRPWLEYVGLSLQDLLGWNWISAIHPEDIDAIVGRWRASLATGEPFLHEARVRRADGEYRWMLHRKVAARDSAGDIVKWYGSSIDIEQRKRSEFFLAEGQRLSHMGSWSFNAAGFDYWSPELFQIHGLDPGGEPPTIEEYLNLVHPEDRGFIKESMEKMLLDRREFDFTKRIVRRDGKTRSVRFFGVPLTQRAAFQGFVGTGMDVTEQEQLTTALRRSEYYLAEGERLARTGSWAWNVPDRSTLHLSGEWYRIFAFDPAGGPPPLEKRLERIHPDDRARWKATIERAIAERTDYEVDFRITLPDATIKWIHSVGHPIFATGGELAQFFGSSTDITERKQAEQRLQERERELQQILDLTPQLLAVLAPDGSPLYANRASLDYLGMGLEQWRQRKTIGDEVHPDDLQRLLGLGQRASSTRSAYELELRVRKGDGSYRWFLSRFNPLHDENGQLTRWYLASTDIEERKRSEERLLQENVALREEIDKASMSEEIVGSSPALKVVLSSIAKVAPNDSTVLITGETGTGKELVARAIHRQSLRASRPFVGVNCAAIPRELIASELFGHERGAFTGASQRRLGRFELADGGTIFLDEVGELPSDTQASLLRVLQEREFERVGGAQPIRVDVRVIAATNRDLQAAVASGIFRQDLFYRLNVFPIEVPPLRNRREDILMLVEYFVQRYAARTGKNIRSIDKRSVELLQSYQWPGNIRELQNVIERSVILASSDVFSVDELWLSKEPSGVRFRPQASLPSGEPDTRLVAERELIEAALADARGRVSGPSGAAAKLGMPPSTLDHRIRVLKIDKNRFKFRAD